MYKKMDYVVYPMHGVGQITEIAKKTVMGKSKEYYVIQLVNTKMTVLVPIGKENNVSLRHIISKREVNKVIKLLQEECVEQEEDWKIRYQNNLLKIKSGTISSVAEVCRNLYKRARDKELSIMERKLYEAAYSLVINEIALAKNISLEDAGSQVSDILSK